LPEEDHPTPQRHTYHLGADLFRGIFAGAYAIDDLHAPGLLAWILIGFIPVVGSLAAARDAYYGLEVRQWDAFVLNLIGLLPFMKGFANLLEVTNIHRIHRAAHIAHQVAHVARHGHMAQAASSRMATNTVATIGHEAGTVALLLNKRGFPLRNGAAWPALLLAVVTSIVAPIALSLLLAIVAGSLYFAHAIPLAVAFGIGLAAVLLSIGTVVLAQHARRTARLLKGHPFSRTLISALAVWLAWLGVLESITVLVFIVAIERGAL
jgi:hypothetical protein